MGKEKYIRRGNVCAFFSKFIPFYILINYSTL